MEKAPHKKNKDEVEEIGSMFGIIVVVLLLAAGGVYFFAVQHEKSRSALPPAEVQSNS